MTILTVLLASTFIAAENLWHFHKKEHGVSVYTKPILQSSLDAFKAQVTLNAQLEHIRNTILDYSEYPTWYVNYSYGEIITCISATEIIVRFVIDVPFPFQDRDSVNRVVVKESNDRLLITLTSEPDILGSKNDHVRMRVSWGQWVLRQAPDDQIDIELTYHADPELPVPGWLANRFLIDGPIQSLINLRNLVE
tara:strand:+ start:58 stop:639 length:582 start_codon:yes stop_codon:yes gene_type:complete